MVSEVKPMTIAARVVVQSLKLAKGKFQRKLETRVAGFAADIEDRWKAGTRA